MPPRMEHLPSNIYSVPMTLSSRVIFQEIGCDKDFKIQSHEDLWIFILSSYESKITESFPMFLILACFRHSPFVRGKYFEKQSGWCNEVFFPHWTMDKKESKINRREKTENGKRKTQTCESRAMKGQQTVENPWHLRMFVHTKWGSLDWKSFAR